MPAMRTTRSVAQEVGIQPSAQAATLAPRRIMHVIDSLARGGAERMLVDLANLSYEDGWSVSVCATRSGGELVKDLAPGIEVFQLGRRKRLDWGAMKRLAGLAREHQIEVLHAHGRSSFSLVAFMKGCGLLSQPVLLHDHFSVEMEPSVPWWFRFAANRFLGSYVGVYDSLRVWARSAGIAPHRIHVISNALNLERLTSGTCNGFVPHPSGSKCGPVGICVGGIRAEKGTDVLLQAVALLRRELNFTLLVVGGMADVGYSKQCQRLCSALGLQDRVLFVGEQSDIPSFLRTADFAVMASRSESGPLVLIEYVAFGLPFVATRVGDVSSRAEALGMTEFVPPNNAGALASAMGRLLRLSQPERRRRGEAGRELLGHFDLRTRMPEWYQVYHATHALR